ncbi:MAG: 50S ribosomal protein L6 [Nanoarchaeota archaeon]
MEKKSIDITIQLPGGIETQIDGNKLNIKGPKGEIEKTFKYPNIKIEKSDSKIIIKSKSKTRKFKRILNTIESHIQNIISGVNNPYIYKLKICSGHFPMKVTQEQDKIVITNFLGEKIPRKAKILPNVNVKIVADIITLEGVDKENTSQSAANIEQTTKIKGRDRRIFQDGCYIVERYQKNE